MDLTKRFLDITLLDSLILHNPITGPAGTICPAGDPDTDLFGPAQKDCQVHDRTLCPPPLGRRLSGCLPEFLLDLHPPARTCWPGPSAVREAKVTLTRKCCFIKQTTPST